MNEFSVSTQSSRNYLLHVLASIRLRLDKTQCNAASTTALLAVTQKCRDVLQQRRAACSTTQLRVLRAQQRVRAAQEWILIAFTDATRNVVSSQTSSSTFFQAFANGRPLRTLSTIKGLLNAEYTQIMRYQRYAAEHRINDFYVIKQCRANRASGVTLSLSLSDDLVSTAERYLAHRFVKKNL